MLRYSQSARRRLHCIKCTSLGTNANSSTQTTTTVTSHTTSTTTCGFICTPSSQCGQPSRYEGPVAGAQFVLQDSCLEDPSCVAYDWDPRQGYGFLCSDAVAYYDEHFIHCLRCTSTTTTTSLSHSTTSTGTMTISTQSTTGSTSSTSLSSSMTYTTSTTTCRFVCNPVSECDQPSRYGGPLAGAQDIVEAACFTDERCAAYDWDETKGYGFLCSDAVAVYDIDKIHCFKCTSTTTTQSITMSTTSASSTTSAACSAIDNRCDNMTVECCPGLQCRDMSPLGLGFRCANEGCPALECSWP